MSTPLCAAIANRHMAATRLLLEHGADPSKLDRINRRPIYYATINGDIGTIELLIDHGASIHDAPVMFTAALHDNISMVEWFLNNGADINSTDAINALKAAVGRDNPPMVKLLLDRGVDVNGVDGLTGTALHMAVCTERVDMIRMLIDVGAILKPSSKGKTPLYHAKKIANETIIKILEDAFGS